MKPGEQEREESSPNRNRVRRIEPTAKEENSIEHLLIVDATDGHDEPSRTQPDKSALRLAEVLRHRPEGAVIGDEEIANLRQDGFLLVAGDFGAIFPILYRPAHPDGAKKVRRPNSSPYSGEMG